MPIMKRFLLAGILVLSFLLVAGIAAPAHAAQFGDDLAAKVQELMKSDVVSPQTKACLSCHIQYTPGIVYDWANSKHAEMTPAALADLYKAIGTPEWADKIADKFKNYNYVIGCYECHGMFKEADRPDVIENHFGYKIVTIVTRKDCSQCHPKESAEISWTWHATGSVMSPFKPWYLGILKWAKSQGADPFGDAQAKALYEKYFPPYLTKQRDVDDINWNFYKEIAKAIMQYVETGQENDIVKMLKEATGMVTPYDYDWKTFISPLWPASGVLNTTLLNKMGIKIAVTSIDGNSKAISNVMEHPSFRNGYIYHACFECHGTVVVPYKKETVTINGMQVNRVALWGWPNNGAARLDPDGSLGTCTACHPRHLFSIKQAREPWTCGQCHLGYDHPHIEIYEESKHGNIWDVYGKDWNWDQIPWRVGVDFNAPTCATCHMSALADANGNILVPGTHDLVKRLVWDQMHFFSIPKGIIPDKMQQALFYGWSQLKGKLEDIEAKKNDKAPEPYKYPVFTGIKIVEDGGKIGETKFPRLLKVEYTGELAKHRAEMEAVCKLCHSSQWTENFFRTADQNMIDYDIVARFANALLQLAWKEGIHDNKNILDEYMEIMWYYIWHHEGRRWRNGVYMMGPDFAHWFGIVDTVMDKLGRMTSYLYTALKIKQIETELQALKQAAAGAPYTPELAAQIAQLQRELESLKAQLAALEAQVPVLKSQLQSLETGYSAIEGDVGSLKTDVNTLLQQLQELSKQLEALSPQAKEIQKLVSEIQQVAGQLQTIGQKAETANAKAEEASMKAEEASNKAGQAISMIEEISKKIDELSSKIDSVSSTAYTLGAIALAAAVIALGLSIVYRRS
ncbi:multiheme c-type cytochrome [Pyrodictium delaneyi]|nr:multiheme c-type cytochrome [Pyrodictium delaneyi]